ncbi:MAG: S9 family peptidase [Bacillaceae bacterium]|nr:S9 family peptidase [Bacillaceae bacterium]
MLLQQFEIPEFHPNARLYHVTYPAQNLKVTGYLAVPRGDGPFPVLVYCRGGIGNVGMTKLAWVSRIVEKGVMVFAPFYRGNRGGEGREDFAGEDRYDVIDALPLLAEHPLADAGRIHLFGFSRGALNALFAAMESPIPRSVAVWGGVSDLAMTYEERVDLRRMLKRVIGGPPWKLPEAYRERSPIFHVQNLPCPVCIIHGTKDQQVSIRHADRLADALQKVEKPYERLIYEGLGHHFPPPFFDQAIRRMLRWMESTVD